MCSKRGVYEKVDESYIGTLKTFLYYHYFFFFEEKNKIGVFETWALVYQRFLKKNVY